MFWMNDKFYLAGGHRFGEDNQGGGEFFNGPKYE
mgnify:CR=1 FL=1